MAAAALAALPLAREGAVASREVIKGLFSALGEPVLRAERVSSTRKGATITRTVASIPAWLPVGAALTYILWKWLGAKEPGMGGGGVPPGSPAAIASQVLGNFPGLFNPQPFKSYEAARQELGTLQQVPGTLLTLLPPVLAPPILGRTVPLATGASGIQEAQITPKPPVPVGTSPAIVGVRRSLSRPSAPGGVFRGF